ncbi:MAG: hypothetical protein INQ03_16320 [Candidatus Heimdallarchaeota archaeon]|nr:hypothetical protein [Candidatus Heimdallarchaeota archaeon]
MNIKKFNEISYGSIWEMNLERWWEEHDDGMKKVPKTPKEMIFSVVSNTFENENITLVGNVDNPLHEEMIVPIFPSPGVFYAYLVESDEVQKKPYEGPLRPPPSPPPPGAMFIPAQTKVEISCSIVLGEYIIGNPKQLEINYVFSTWHEPRPRWAILIDYHHK